MASITFAIDKELKLRMGKFPWVNWSEAARESLLEKGELEDLRRKLGAKEEKKFIKWSVELGKKAKKGRFKQMLAELSPEDRRKLVG